MTTLLLGCLLIVITLTLEALVISLAIQTLRRVGPGLLRTGHFLRRLGLLVAVSLWLLAGLGMSTGIWALALWGIGAIPDWHTALYFSMVAFTTLGLGDVTLPEEWRLLTGFVAANGLLLFSMSTAFLIEVMKQVNQVGPAIGDVPGGDQSR